MFAHAAVGEEDVAEHRVSGLLLKEGIRQGLTPFELASFYIRKEGPSTIEKIVQECVERVKYYQAARHSVMENDGGLCRFVGSMLRKIIPPIIS